MPIKYYDIIIVGSGIAGLYSAYNIKKLSPNTSFLVLEKYKKKWLGGRTSNETFYDTQIVTGAGVGRKHKDKLLTDLVKEMHIPTTQSMVKPHYAKTMEPLDIDKAMQVLRKEYHLASKKPTVSFKEFATSVLGEKVYKRFLISAGYTDYQNEDILETLYYYGMEDNECCWTSVNIPWKRLIDKLCERIGYSHIKTSSEVVKIEKHNNNPCLFFVYLQNGIIYLCNKVIVATTISGIRNIVPGASNENSIYRDIEGQPFLRLYGKFSKSSIPIMKEYVKGYTILPGPLQKIIPMNSDKGVYMIAYSDNENAILLKNLLKNTSENRAKLCELLEKSLGIKNHSLNLIAIKDYYWPIGTHYYKPLDKAKYISRDDFINKAQNPMPRMLVVGEVVSRNQGWTEGALESVKKVLTKKWIEEVCSY